DEVGGLREAVGARDELIANLGALRDALQAEIATLRRDAVARDELIASLGTLRDALQAEVATLRRGTATRDELIASLGTLRDALQAEVVTLRRDAAVRDEAIAGLQRSGAEKDDLIASFNYHLLSVQRTIGWKVLERLRRLRDHVLPPDSRRRDIYW